MLPAPWLAALGATWADNREVRIVTGQGDLLIQKLIGGLAVPLTTGGSPTKLKSKVNL